MYVTWPCPMPNGTTGEEMALCFDSGRSRRVLIISPLFDEANKFRHQIFEIMRKLDANGVDCFLPDLPGCNESLAEFSEQTLDHWRSCIEAAAKHFSATEILTARSGSWLVPATGSGFLYAPAKPQQVLRSMIRARVLSAREAGREETSDSLIETGQKDGIELAGWQLGSKLVTELAGSDLSVPDGYSVIEQAEVGGKPLWLRAENDSDPAQADALVGLMITAGQDA